MTTKQKWTDERTATLTAIVGADKAVEVARDVVEAAATSLEVSVRSIVSKLGKLGYSCEKAATKGKLFSDEQGAELLAFLESNSGKYTYAEVAAQIFGGQFNAKQIQGKVLHLEATSHIKPTEKAKAVKVYSDADEATYLAMAAEGASAEAIAEALGKDVRSVMGKALDFEKRIEGFVRPKQVNVKPASVDPIEALTDIASMTVASIAEAVNKTEKGVKSILTHRGITCADYDGAKRRAKIDAKKAA